MHLWVVGILTPEKIIQTPFGIFQPDENAGKLAYLKTSARLPATVA
jgi:hypothetical protein